MRNETGRSSRTNGSSRAGAVALLLALTLGTGVSRAYEQPTHVVLSAQAFNLSVLGDFQFQYDIGAFGFGNDFTLQYVNAPDSTGVLANVYALVQLGSWYEDNGLRSLNHFFNPVNNQPLTPPFISTSTSPDWALEDKGQISGQN